MSDVRRKAIKWLNEGKFHEGEMQDVNISFDIWPLSIGKGYELSVFDEGTFESFPLGSYKSFSSAKSVACDLAYRILNSIERPAT